jgi:multiple sugar transport system ATP-binding protein
LRGVTKVYPGGVEALAGVDLAVAGGEFVTVVGPSGSGKSTLLRVIAGLERPETGEIWIGPGRVDDVAPHRRGVAMVLQGQPPFPHLDVFENLAFGLRARRVPAREVRTRVEETASWLGLADVLRRRPRALSGGQKQRVVLGRALTREAGVVLLDEPLSDLDAPLRAAIREGLVARHGRLRDTVVLVTHDQEEALALGDRVAVLDRGRLVQLGTPREVYDRPVSRFVAGFLGRPPMNLLACAVELDEGALRLRLVGPGSEAARSVPRGASWAAPLGRRGAGPVEIGLRPEHVVAADSVGGEVPSNCLAVVGRVQRLEPLGHQTVATLAIGSGLVRARLSNRETRREGDLLPVYLDLAAAVWFDPSTGLLLE